MEDNTILFRVNGTPKGQPRPRAFARGGRARVYDPGTAEGWKSEIALAARASVPPKPLEGPLNVRIDLWFARPKGHYTKKGLKDSSPLEHTSKPDADNCAKAVLDAMTTLGFWGDDSQIACLLIHKRYAGIDGAGAMIRVGPL